MKTGIYIHIPFCKRKCNYCDFRTLPLDQEAISSYQSALLEEIALWQRKKLKIGTVYFGGGSPSLYPVSFIEKLLDSFTRSFDFIPEEITLEANPFELNEENLLKWKSAGINRLSVGVQSLTPEVINRTGRLSPEITMERLGLARKVFDNLNMDFILGLPGESEDNLERNLKAIKTVVPDHISYYILDTDHDTPLMRNVANGNIELPGNELIGLLHEKVLAELEKLGYNRYEISSWEKNGKGCKHNINYWKNGNYIGLGIAAGGHVDKLRFVNTYSFENYSEALGRGEFSREYEQKNDEINEIFESIFMGLRLIDGFVFEDLSENKILINEIKARMMTILSKYLSIENDRVFMNSHGLDFSRVVLEELVGIKEEIENVFSS